ncbi:MAG TPA: AAA family ATPase [Candidatus Nitrosotalea sp.]|nr:AAA family ATPase [Candidatus Nitrosotalea sp.]
MRARPVEHNHMSTASPEGAPLTTSIADIVSKVERENLIFANKRALDALSLPTKILGREEQIEKIVRFLLGYRYGHVVPFISIYGRSGSGKTTVVKHVCKEFNEAEHEFVNLRRARTVFGATNLVLASLGLEPMKGSGNKMPYEKMHDAISIRLEKNKKKLFVLVLDEFDVIFGDPRGRPSDFIYQLLELEKDLSQKGFYFCAIGISNNVLSGYDLDDRVKSRIGTSEIFFAPYHYGNVKTILEERAQKAFICKIDDVILEQCAKIASQDHGDARRAIDLLRVAAEAASAAHKPLSVAYVDQAARDLQKDRIENVLTDSSYNFKRVLAAIARITFLSKEEWHYTSVIVQQYRKVWFDKAQPLSYRRVSEILREMEDMGLVMSQISSRGRQGYGKQYKLEMPLHVVGRKLNANWWYGLLEAEKIHNRMMKYMKKTGDLTEKQKNRMERNEAVDEKEKHWDNYVWNDDDGEDDSAIESGEF